MPRHAVALASGVLACLLLLIVVLTAAGCTPVASADTELLRAGGLRAAGNYAEAVPLYQSAMKQFRATGEARKAEQCRSALEAMEITYCMYPLSETDARDGLAAAFPQVPESERDAWLADGVLDHITLDGRPAYFSGAVDNQRFRNLDLMHQDASLPKVYAKFVEGVVNNIAPAAGAAWQTYTSPNSYSGVGTLSVPRSELPAAGILKLWFPLPLTLGFQQPVKIVSIEPAEYVKLPPTTTGDIGLVYMEVPLEELKGDLNARIEFTFTHYEQHFTVDPALVLQYDKSDPEYQKYTVSEGNIVITPEIRATANRVVGTEKNPYMAAKKIYDYMLKNIEYSYLPHQLMYPRSDIRESVFVHEHGYGDCGGQGIYFSALCRAVGIPARCTGGWQLMSGSFSGHFWAEFLVPGYGWLPVDTNAGQMQLFSPGLTDAQRMIYSDFYFGNQDAFRCVVQKNVDTPFVPAPEALTLQPIALQDPQAVCDTYDGCIGLVISSHWQLEAKVLEQSHDLGIGQQ